MLVTVNTSFIPPENFRLLVRKNATTKPARRCPVADPPWLAGLLASGCQLQVKDIVLQARRHFSDAVNGEIFGPSTTRRQAAMAIAWTIVSMASPYVKDDRLFVEDLLDPDIKRLCSEVFGVGLALELLRSQGVVDGRTIRKVADKFDYEAFGSNGTGVVKIEAKGTFNDASTSEHRRSIAKKLTTSGLPRGYDSAVGIIASLWTKDELRAFDVEICDPARKPERHFEEAVREVIRFYARRFDESVAIEEGTELLFSIANDRQLFGAKAPSLLQRLTPDPRKIVAEVYHNRLKIKRGNLVEEFWGRLWEPRKLPIPLSLESGKGKKSAFMGLDSTIFRLLWEREFEKLLSYRTNDNGLWSASGSDYAAVFSVDSYGVIRGLVEGDLPMEVETT
jgi:hypothetical protein